MSTIRRGDNFVRRNDRCVCGSGKKFKACCSPTAPQTHRFSNKPAFIDTGEIPVRWLISDNTATQFFADKDNRALVFNNRAAAYAVASLDLFNEQAPGEINVAGVGETKWQLLQEKIPFVEVPDIETAARLIAERIDYGNAGELTESPPLDLTNGNQEENISTVSDGGEGNPQEEEQQAIDS